MNHKHVAALDQLNALHERDLRAAAAKPPGQSVWDGRPPAAVSVRNLKQYCMDLADKRAAEYAQGQGPANHAPEVKQRGRKRGRKPRSRGAADSTEHDIIPVQLSPPLPPPPSVYQYGTQLPPSQSATSRPDFIAGALLAAGSGVGGAGAAMLRQQMASTEGASAMDALRSLQGPP